jgi:hypothetical protein
MTDAPRGKLPTTPMLARMKEKQPYATIIKEFLDWAEETRHCSLIQDRYHRCRKG